MTSFPVLVDPQVVAPVVLSDLRMPVNLTSGQLCPVCGKGLEGQPLSLVMIGRYPEDPDRWAAATVLVHDGCTG